MLVKDNAILQGDACKFALGTSVQSHARWHVSHAGCFHDSTGRLALSPYIMCLSVRKLMFSLNSPCKRYLYDVPDLILVKRKVFHYECSQVIWASKD